MVTHHRLVNKDSNGKSIVLKMATCFTNFKGRVCVSDNDDIRRQILFECHDSPSAGHPRIQKTYVLLKRQFFWPGINKDVQDYVLRCQKCQVLANGKVLLGFYCWIT